MGGRSKKRIGRIPKYSEKKRQQKKINKIGRPKRKPKGAITSLYEIKDVVSSLGVDWSEQSEGDEARFVKLCTFGQSQSIVTHSIIFSPDLRWKLYVHGQEVVKDRCSLLKETASTIEKKADIRSIFAILSGANVCAGHPDDKFIKMLNAKRRSSSGESSPYLDSYASVQLNDSTYSQTVRSPSCEMLSQGPKCPSCVEYRSVLRSAHNRWNKTTHRSPSKFTSTSSRTPFTHLRTPEKRRRYSLLRARAIATEKRLARLRKRLKESIDKSGVTVENELHSDLVKTMDDNNEEIKKKYAEGTFRRLFWDQQMQAAKAKKPTQVRWHPMMIRWCLHLKLLSSSAYHAMRSSGYITLPSERTLRDYTRWIESNTGCQPEVTQQLLDELNKVKLPEHLKSHVAVVFDEVKIKEGIVYDKHNCRMLGFVDMGDINNELLQFQRSLEDANDLKETVAKQMLVFMVRGIFASIDFPYAQFTTRGISGDQLYPVVWEVVKHLECAGLQVHALTCDKASPNRKFFRLHQTNPGELTYKTVNPYSADQRYIYFFSDVPHLIKTIRNAASNSFAHNNKRFLWINEKHVSWGHILAVYNQCRMESGLSLLPKIKREHVFLTSYSRMRVDLAAQVLSSSMAAALEYYGDDGATETVRFLRTFDRFFDCLNTRHSKEGLRKRKPDLFPYVYPTDMRFKWLEEDLLGYLSDWEESVKKRKGFTAAQKKLMLLPDSTMEGIRITVKSFIELSRSLLSKPGVQYLFSERFTQDPLESFFGRQRSSGGWSDNPSVQQFLDGTVSLRVQGSVALKQIRGNCRKRPLDKDLSIDNTPLPKRKRKGKSH